MAAANETPLWESSKENTAPLRRGRNVAQLEQALEDTDENRLRKERTVDRYEKLVRPSEQEDYTPGESSSAEDDPLINWLGYIKFHQESYPTGSHDQFLLLERCFRALARFRRYANDVRFIRVCCQYAEKTERPNEIFKYLYQQKIGAETAIFWIAWGFVAEKREEWKFANDIYTKGIRKRAKPLEKLNKRYREFQRRMARHWLNATQTQDEDEEGESGNRGVLGALSEDAVQFNDRSSSRPPGPSFLSRPSNTSQGTLQGRQNTFIDRSSSSSSRQTNIEANGSGGTAFQIFQDDEHAENNPLDDSFLQGEAPYRQLERESDRKKENNLTAERWNERGAYAPSYGQRRPPSKPRTTKPTPFAVYVDEECVEEHRRQENERRQREYQHRRVRDERTFREREDLYESESLVQDPLRYVRDPAQLAIDQSARAKTKASQIHSEGSGARKTANAGFSTRLLRDATTGAEQCFEEARALACYYKLSSPSMTFNLLQKSQRSDDMQLDDGSENNDDDDVSMTDSAHPDAQNTLVDHEKSSLENPVDRSIDYSAAQNISAASSTVDGILSVPHGRADPTINTQIAMKELSMMFSSPAIGLNDSALLNRSGGLGPILNESGFSETAEDNEKVSSENQADADEPKCAQSHSFTVYAEEIAQRKESESLLKPTGFTIYSDENGKEKESQHEIRETPPAAFAVFEESEEQQQGASKNPEQDEDEQKTCSSPIKTDESAAGDGDTASLSLFDEAMRILDDSGETTEKRQGDHVNLESVKRRRMTSTTEDLESLEIFGDISCILPSDETTELVGTSLAALHANAIEYDSYHKQNVKSAVRLLSSKSTPFPKNSKSLGKILSKEDFVSSLPSHVLPQSLRLQKSSIAAGTDINLGKSTVSVKQELGRGAYGCVFLIDTSSTTSENQVAVKAQAPIGSLAWEYVILSRLYERFRNGVGSQKRLPFPKPLSFVSLADGAFLTMEAVSSSGLNFIDLVNVHRQSRGEPALPEVLALHYVSRMLDVLESLHWFGNILHCDTKADNWVIASSDLVGGENIDGSNVVLTDFGRAIDLQEVSRANPLESKLKGKASRDDMMCVAMRQGLPWSFDIDTYGLCDTAHVLLFGCNLEIERSTTTGRFAPKQRFRRYHQRELWSTLFDTLLNLEQPSKTAIGSRPRSLRQIRVKFEAHLAEKETELKAQLKHQAAFLPLKRPGVSPRNRKA